MNDLLPEPLTLPFNIIRVEWRRNRRAQRVSLRIDLAGSAVIVTLPLHATRKTGMMLLMSHVDWVTSRLAALPNAIQFTDGAVIPIHGKPHRIRHAANARGGVWIADNELHVTGGLEFLSRRVCDFLRQEARRCLTTLTMAKASQIRIVPRRVTMKDTSTRWGSCARDKSIALSWRLVMAPDFVQDYVAGHEVAHLCHMNHGRQFWSLVEELTPHKRTAVPWLRTEGVRLLRIG